MVGGERPAAAAGLRRFLCGAAVLLLALAFAPAAFANTYVVTSSADSGSGTLRDAITLANESVGLDDTITFDLPFADSTIVPFSNLPTITDGLFVDGSTPGATNGQQHVRLAGTALDSTGVGLRFATSPTAQDEVRGLTITQFQQTGLDLGVNAVTVSGDYIGTDQ